VLGPDEFVTDSYKIRQGKLAILRMQGVDIGCLPYSAMEEYIDTISEDDILLIVLYHPTRKDLIEIVSYINNSAGGFRVRCGCIDLPNIDSVVVEGLTLDQAEERIRKEFSKQIQNVEVYVSYKQRLKKKVELIGMISADSVPVDGKIRLYETLAKARVSPQANFFKSYVVRDGCPLSIDLNNLLKKGDLSQNIVMRGGDKIYIAPSSAARVMVMGEVGVPTPVDVPEGFISLKEALVAARGIPFTGDKRNIQIIRGDIPNPKIYVLSWEHIIHLPNQSLLLMPGDTVYVSEKPITSWNRFIDQLLPSFAGIQSGNALYRLCY